MIEREPEGGDEAAGLLHVLPAQAAVVDRVALRQRPRRQVLQEIERIALRHARHGHALDGGAVELLKMIERFRHRRGRDASDRRQRDRRTVAGADVVVEQLLRVQPVALLHLRDDLVGAPAHAEIVDVAAAQHGGKRAADVAHLEPELRGLVAVDGHVDLRIVELEIAVEKDEHAALQRVLQELLGDVVEALERLGGADDELHRQADAARQRRRLERDDAHAGDLARAPAAGSAAAGWSCWCARPRA